MCVGLKKHLYSGYSPYIRGGVWVFGPQTSVLYNSGNRYINSSRLSDFRDFTGYALKESSHKKMSFFKLQVRISFPRIQSPIMHL